MSGIQFIYIVLHVPSHIIIDRHAGVYIFQPSEIPSPIPLLNHNLSSNETDYCLKYGFAFE